MAGDEANRVPVARAQGIECPRCGCRHLYVVYTRHRNKKILRVRECRHCGRRIKTYEQMGG
jgi:transcriptional regulator NrdR family protein